MSIKARLAARTIAAESGGKTPEGNCTKIQGREHFADVPALQEFFMLSDLHLTRGPALAATIEVCTNAECERC